jgi:alpha-glucosidase
MRETTRYGLPNGTDWRSWPATGPHDILDPERGATRARAAALLFLGLPGSAYLYQGEELGLPEVWDLPDEVLDDPVWERSGHEFRGRDGCRVPLPWTGDGPSLGFGSGPSWLPQPPGFAALAASAQVDDPGSMLDLVTEALALRRKWGVADEELEFLDLGPAVVAYRRGSGLTCVVNLGPEPIDLPPHRRVLLSSAPGPTLGDTPVPDASPPAGTSLAPDTAVWLL